VTSQSPAKTDSAEYKSFLDSVPILKGLSDEQKLEMAGALKEKEYQSGSNVICEGDEGDKFYLIREGEVKCTKAGVAEEISRRLVRGDFFGELALLSADKRAATVTVTSGKCSLLSLERDQFTRLLGPLKDMLSEAGASTYQ